MTMKSRQPQFPLFRERRRAPGIIFLLAACLALVGNNGGVIIGRVAAVAAAAAATADAATSSGGSATTTTCVSARGRDLLEQQRRQDPPPFVTPSTWLPASISLATDDKKEEEEGDIFSAGPMQWTNVTACCQPVPSAALAEETCASGEDGDDSPSSFPALERVVIGRMPSMNQAHSFLVMEAAVEAWKDGAGVWPQMTVRERCTAMETFLEELSKQRDAMIRVLQWEIGKNVDDATSEFDRTVQFVRDMIEAIRTDPEFGGGGDGSSVWQKIASTTAFVRRAAIGIIACLGPFNYPLNETYAVLMSALLMGNIVILKIPSVGGLVHLLAMEAAARAFPPGAINFLAGSGRDLVPPLLWEGKTAGLAVIGSSRAADNLLSQHNALHRLRVFFQLEANNMGIFLPDLFEDIEDGDDNKAQRPLQHALDQAVVGSLSYNGQRCTALKLLYIPAKHADSFAAQFAERVQALSVGLPWQEHSSASGDKKKKHYSKITPLPTPQRVEFMQSLIEDAVQKGAKIINEGGGTVLGGPDSTLMIPAVLYPVTRRMKIFDEEQFGPVVPIAVYDDFEKDVLQVAQKGKYGQQVSLFGQDAELISTAVDRLSTVFGKINLNGQCGRSPDTLPFTGRRSSAMGTMSVKDALREFSVPTVIAYKDNTAHGIDNENLARHLERTSNFVQPAAA